VLARRWVIGGWGRLFGQVAIRPGVRRVTQEEIIDADDPTALYVPITGGMNIF
jgi:hypothetical protein